MVKYRIIVLFAILLLAACSGSPTEPATAPPTPNNQGTTPDSALQTPASTAEAEPSAIDPAYVSPTEAVVQVPFPTAVTAPEEQLPVEGATPLMEPTAAAPATQPPPVATIAPVTGQDLAVTLDDVILHPGPTIYSGERVTFQVLPYVPESIPVTDVGINIYVNGVELVNSFLQGRNWNGQASGIYQWAWNTDGTPGQHEIRVVLDAADRIVQGDEDPTNNEAVLIITILDAASRPADVVEAQWVSQETNCCVIHAVSNTAAARDMAQLVPAVEAAVAQASSQLSEPLAQKINFYFINRVLGQGGFAGNDIVVSYADRGYAGGGLHELLTHEATHIIDQQFAPRRIRFLAEGLAVWSSGGHYKQEDLNQRSAALLTLGQYVPLQQLVDNFYPVQHEIGYLQAAGFITYLIDNYGWSTFRAFYGDVAADDGATESAALDVNLQQYYGRSLAQIEAEWLAYLESHPPSQAAVEDLAASIRFYDIMRRYQMEHDPTAYFLTAWLPHPGEVRESGNVADLSRHPQTEMNIALEVMLQSADNALRKGDYNFANVVLDSVSRILDNGGVFIDPLAINYLNIVRAAAAEGYELQQVDLQGNDARAIVSFGDSSHLTTLTLALRGQDWVILSH